MLQPMGLGSYCMLCNAGLGSDYWVPVLAKARLYRLRA